MVRFALMVLAGLGLTTPTLASSQLQLPLRPGTVREGTLGFDGHATTGDFTGNTSTITGEMSGGATLPEIKGWVEAPVKTLDTDNDRRDRDMNKSLESDKYPTIRFELDQAIAQGTLADSMDVTLRGKFLIHGVTREVELPATLVFLSDGVRVRSTTPLNLKDYKIGGLSKFLGVLKMSEKIEVHVDVTFGYQ
ncbi:MAG TPA: YceI family protein [Gemmatimonadales bacterium]|nr:YceI family protein [Gemmatimonadales bacterium]